MIYLENIINYDENTIQNRKKVFYLFRKIRYFLRTHNTSHRYTSLGQADQSSFTCFLQTMSKVSHSFRIHLEESISWWDWGEQKNQKRRLPTSRTYIFWFIRWSNVFVKSYSEKMSPIYSYLLLFANFELLLVYWKHIAYPKCL